MIFVTHFLFKQNQSFVSTTLSSFSRYNNPFTFKCRSPISVCFGTMQLEHLLGTPLFFTDRYQICSVSNLGLFFNFAENVQPFSHWVTDSWRSWGNDSLVSSNISRLISICANTLFDFSTEKTTKHPNNMTAWFSICYSRQRATT